MMDGLIVHVLNDLELEKIELDTLIKDLPRDAWNLKTTAEGWTIYDQIAHLTLTDAASLLAITSPSDFLDEVSNSDIAALEEAEAQALTELANHEKDELLGRWRDGHEALRVALSQADPDTRIPWYGPPMKPASMATARMMETWAHSLDVYDALSKTKPQHDRVRHVCDIGIRTRKYVHQLHGLPVPESEFSVRLTSPSGQSWLWGPEVATETVTGDAWGFAMLATRRRHRDDVNVDATGIASNHWLDIIQTFAGDPGTDPVRLNERANQPDRHKEDT